MDELSARLLCHQLSLSPSKLSKALVDFGSASRLLASDTTDLGHYFKVDDVHKIRACRGATDETLRLEQRLAEQQV